MRERTAVVTAPQLFLGEGPPDPVDDLVHVTRDIPGSTPRCSARDAAASSRASVGSWADDVHLGVVEERVLVEVRGADGEPAVVDDADLRMHVHRAA